MFTNFDQYRIVCPQNPTVHEALFSKLLQYYLHSHYDCDLEIVKDTEESAEYEILIGNTNRTTSHPENGTFSFLVEEKKLQLHATDMQSYEALYHYTTQSLLSRKKEAMTCTVNIRCMFYNVYGWTAQCGPVSERQKLQIELIKTYMPDFLAFQEYSKHYRSFDHILKELGYDKVRATEAVENYTPLFYKQERLKVIDSGYLLYTGPNDVNSKSATWAVFELIETHERFIAISTHLMYNQPGIDANAARISNATELLSLIVGLRGVEAYKGLPLIIGGDFNCDTASDPISMLKENGLRLAWDTAEIKNNIKGIHDYVSYDKNLETYSSWSIRPGGYAGSIDHVFVSEHIAVKKFFTLTDMYALISSDHMPELVEINLNKIERI